MNEPLRPRRPLLNRLRERQNARYGRLRLLGLFLLFDALLVVAVLLSFQGTELIHEEEILVQTREAYDVEIVKQEITHTTVTTRVMPYGWVE
jgi:hypothetical protein